jgi:hypothetical protein
MGEKVDNMMPPNHALQRLERSGESTKGILLRPMEQKAEGRMCRAAHESTAPRPSRHCCNPRLPRAESPASAGLGR